MTAAEEAQLISEAAESIRENLGGIPDTLVVTGSGLGPFADHVTEAKAVDYGALRHFPVSAVTGHAGKLLTGKAGNKPVVVMAGRKHLYEGIDPKIAVLPLRALLKLGVRTVILSNAAGALNRTFAVGDLMLITDHVNMQFRNPLIGANLNDLGPRFPDMSEPYSHELRNRALESARELGITLRQGVYIANMGPSYETYAEVEMLKMMGDAVGMSTAPETLAARHAGARVLGISLISNSLVNRTNDEVTHDEVMETAAIASGKFCRLVEHIVERLPAGS